MLISVSILVTVTNKIAGLVSSPAYFTCLLYNPNCNHIRRTSLKVVGDWQTNRMPISVVLKCNIS